MLKAEFMKWIFRFAIIKLRLQLRYLANEQQLKTSFHADAWHATQKRPLHLWNSENMPIALNQFFCLFRNHWINFWIVVRVFRTQLGLICVRQIQVWLYLSVDEQCKFLDRMDFDAIF